MTDAEGSRDLLILGAAGGWALTAAELAEASGWRVRGLVNNLPPGEVHLPDCPYPILQLAELPPDLLALPAFCCLTTPQHRRRLVHEAAACGLKTFARLIHPSAQILPSAVLGEGVYVGTASAVFTRAVLANHVLLLNRVLVGHNARIDNFASIGPGGIVSSWCHIQDGAFVGPAATVLPRVTVGKNSVVAAGSVVMRDVPDQCLVAGVPAAIKREGYPGYRRLDERA